VETVLTQGLAAIAALFSAWAAVTARRQLRHDQDTAGGRGIAFDVATASQALRNGKAQANFTVRLELYGPGARYQAELCLVRKGGFYVDSLGDHLSRDDAPEGIMKQGWKVLRCTDDPVRWDFSVVPASAVTDEIWCMFSWIDPRGESLWTGAFARRLNDPGVLYEWRWYRTRRLRKWLRRWGATRPKQRPWHRWAGKVKPLGRWQVHPGGELIGKQGPSENLDNL
jgi:hypothetical protein